ncbi:MAG: hypothetical protein ACR2F6_12300 [Mycobacteriales bacterium]
MAAIAATAVGIAAAARSPNEAKHQAAIPVATIGEPAVGHVNVHSVVNSDLIRQTVVGVAKSSGMGAPRRVEYVTHAMFGPANYTLARTGADATQANLRVTVVQIYGHFTQSPPPILRKAGASGVERNAICLFIREDTGETIATLETRQPPDLAAVGKVTELTGPLT